MTGMPLINDSVQSKKQAVVSCHAEEEADDDPPCQTNEEIAKEQKEKGNAHFKNQEFEQAIEAYSKAITVQSEDASLWLNRSIASRQLKHWNSSLDDATRACELQPTNVKALYGKGLALQELGRNDEAMDACMLGLKEQADNKALLSLKKTLTAQIAAKKKLEKEKPSPFACPATLMAQETVVPSTGEVYKWKGKNPNPEERASLKKMMVDLFLEKYIELRDRSQEIEAKSGKSVLKTDFYDQQQKMGLLIEGGHQAMPRPEGVELPDKYMDPVGILTVEEMGRFHSKREDRRYLVSVWGEIFDVSDRPDKYGPNAPYRELTGRDLSWGLFTGIDHIDMSNKFYDLFKAKDMGKDKLGGLASWRAWFETEYGEAVGTLEPWTHDWDLPAPPMAEMEDQCSIM